MRIALINSGLGLLAAAAALRRMRPDADLVLAMDPEGMPWGPRRPDDIAARSLACARAAAYYRPDVLVFACNTGSVHALGVLRAEFEPGLPVVGTVPAIKPAAAAGRPAAIWATAATTGSAYQRGLIEQFAAGVPVAEVACPGLADAIHVGDEARVGAAIVAAAAQTPPGTGAVVLGCTEYELVADRIRAAVPGAVPFGSAEAVAAQALRRAAGLGGPAAGDGASGSGSGAEPGTDLDGTDRDGTELGTDQDGTDLDGTDRDGTELGTDRDGTDRDGTEPGTDLDGTAAGRGHGEVRVLLSGRPGQLPVAALLYPEGRLLVAVPDGVRAS